MDVRSASSAASARSSGARAVALAVRVALPVVLALAGASPRRPAAAEGGAFAAPEFRVTPELPAGLERLARQAWLELAQVVHAEGLPAATVSWPVRLVADEALPPGQAGASRPGVIALRPGLPPVGAGGLAVRHEVAHQLLFAACPSATGDRLFHEAFALAASGELASWTSDEGGRYASIAAALEALGRARSLDAPSARRALARLLSEAPARPGRLPAALARPLSRCEPGATWVPLRPEDLAESAPAADALVILSRHTGEALVARGAVSLPLPFGSTLKPFLLAGTARPSPRLRPDPSRPGWRCGAGLPARVDAVMALLRSCNGWFLDWAARDPGVVRMGAWGPALVALGLSRLPADAAEAIGVRPALRISPLALAHAYRLLAEARPDLLDVLSRNAREGTLSGLPASGALAGVAAKTGTVLDAATSPRLGLVAAVDRDLVLVMARQGVPPRGFSTEVAAALADARAAARQAARVQVLGLVAAGDVEGRCAGRGFAAAAAGPVPAPDGFAPLAALARRGPLVCAGGPWLLRYPGLAEARAYAGVLTSEPPPPLAGGDGPQPTAREARARRGSELVLRTTRLAYAAGVAAAEDDALRGEPRIALARVADANAANAGSRHLGRPPCDTTHCQAFRGTVAPLAEDRAALAAPLRRTGWLPFSRGGDAAWSEERQLTAVAATLGGDPRDLEFAAGRVAFTADGGDAAAPFRERRSVPCERLRGPLKLPACPDRAALRADRVRFEGRGAGHGEGLDLAWAKRSGLSADAILERAYGARKRAR